MMTTKRCPAFCKSSCKIQHHPLLIALINTGNPKPTESPTAASFCALAATITRYEKLGTWSMEKDIPDPVTDYQYPLMHWAAALGKYDVVKWLISRKCCLTSKRKNGGDTALHNALNMLHKSCKQNAVKVFRIMVPIFQRCLTLANKEGNTPLHSACQYMTDDSVPAYYYKDCFLAIVEFAQKEKILPVLLRAQNGNGDTPLHILVRQQKNSTIIQNLMETCRVDITLKNNANKNAFEEAVANCQLDIVNIFSGLEKKRSSMALHSPCTTRSVCLAPLKEQNKQPNFSAAEKLKSYMNKRQMEAKDHQTTSPNIDASDRVNHSGVKLLQQQGKVNKHFTPNTAPDKLDNSNPKVYYVTVEREAIEIGQNFPQSTLCAEKKMSNVSENEDINPLDGGNPTDNKPTLIFDKDDYRNEDDIDDEDETHNVEDVDVVSFDHPMVKIENVEEDDSDYCSEKRFEENTNKSMDISNGESEVNDIYLDTKQPISSLHSDVSIQSNSHVQSNKHLHQDISDQSQVFVQPQVSSAGPTAQLNDNSVQADTGKGNALLQYLQVCGVESRKVVIEALQRDQQTYMSQKQQLMEKYKETEKKIQTRMHITFSKKQRISEILKELETLQKEVYELEKPSPELEERNILKQTLAQVSNKLKSCEKALEEFSS